MEEPREEDMQNALVHEGGPAPHESSNEKADDKADIQQPSGESVDEVLED